MTVQVLLNWNTDRKHKHLVTFSSLALIMSYIGNMHHKLSQDQSKLANL